MKIARSVAALFVLLVWVVPAQDLFLGSEQFKKLLEFKDGQRPPLPACPEGEYVPLMVNFSQKGEVQGEPVLWKGSRRSWLYQNSASRVITQAVSYIKKATFKLTGKKRRVVVPIPCQPQ
jgi:hypothetical protein